METFFIVGKKINLREVRESDVNQNYYSWLNDMEVNQYLESRFFPNSIDSIKNFVSSLNGSNSSTLFAIIENETHSHVGNIKLGPINWIHRLGDIGLLIGKENWGKGYATEAIGLVVNYAFTDLNLHKVTAGAYSDNLGSIRAFEKNGFFVEGQKKEHAFYKGKYSDVVLLGIINKNG
jgi:RimJ/RimL family protein N-acetyltransferase